MQVLSNIPQIPCSFNYANLRFETSVADSNLTESPLGSKWNPFNYNISGELYPAESSGEVLLKGLSRDNCVVVARTGIGNGRGTQEVFGPLGLAGSFDVRQLFWTDRAFKIGEGFITFRFDNVPLIEDLSLAGYVLNFNRRLGHPGLSQAFSTENIDFSQYGLSAEHPYISFLKMIRGEVTAQNCFQLNSRLMADPKMKAFMRKLQKNPDYLYRFHQVLERTAKACSLPVVEFGTSSKEVKYRECGGIVISPFGDVLTTLHAMGSANYIRKAGRELPIGTQRWILRNDNLDLGIIRIPLSVMKKLFGTFHLPVAKLTFSATAGHNIFMWGFPHLGYPEHPTELLFSFGRIVEIPDETKLYANLLSLHGNSGSPVFNFLGECLGILTASCKFGIDRAADYTSILRPGEAAVIKTLGALRKNLQSLIQTSRG